MRAKKNRRRQAIIDAAAEIFRELGYERTTMAAISARVGGSKATLYSYFPSKEDIFTAVMIQAMESQAKQVLDLLSTPRNGIRQALETFGRALLKLTLSADVLSVTRLGISEGSNSNLGAKIYEIGPRHAWREVASHFARWNDEGLLKAPDPGLAALHFKGLLEAGLLEPRLFGAETSIEKDYAVTSAIDVFLHAYGAATK